MGTFGMVPKLTLAMMTWRKSSRLSSALVLAFLTVVGLRLPCTAAVLFYGNPNVGCCAEKSSDGKIRCCCEGAPAPAQADLGPVTAAVLLVDHNVKWSPFCRHSN